MWLALSRTISYVYSNAFIKRCMFWANRNSVAVALHCSPALTSDDGDQIPRYHGFGTRIAGADGRATRTKACVHVLSPPPPQDTV